MAPGTPPLPSARRALGLLPALLLALTVLAGESQATDRVSDALGALRSPNVLRRVEAATFLGGMADPAVSDPAVADRILLALTRTLKDPKSDVRKVAALSLTRRGDRRALAPILAGIPEEADAQTLCALLLAVGALGREADGVRLVPIATADPRPRVRAAAVSALGDLGGEQARRIAVKTVLRPGLPDPDWSLRATGMLALARCGRPEDVGEVLVAYREGRGEASWFARSALARLVAAKDTDPVPLLLRLVGDPDSRVAVTAAAGLGRSGHVAALLRLLSHVVPSVRAAAATGIAKAHVRKGYGRLRALARLDPSRKVRWAAALALFQAEDPLGDELVVSAVEAREPAVWAEAIAQLAARTGERHGRDAKAWRAALLRWRAGR